MVANTLSRARGANNNHASPTVRPLKMGDRLFVLVVRIQDDVFHWCSGLIAGGLTCKQFVTDLACNEMSQCILHVVIGYYIML